MHVCIYIVKSEMCIYCSYKKKNSHKQEVSFNRFISTIAFEHPEAYEETLLGVISSALSDLEKPERIVRAVNLVIEDGSLLFSHQDEMSRTEVKSDEREIPLNSIRSKVHPFMLQGILNGITELWCRHRYDFLFSFFSFYPRCMMI